MRARILAVALGMGALGLMASCDLGQSLNDTLSVFSVKFSAGDTPFVGPTLVGPSVGQSLVDFATPNALGGKSKDQIIATYSLKLLFNVKADNTKNSNRAAFGSSAIKPILLFRVQTESADPIRDTIQPFEVEAGRDTTYPFEILVPATTLNNAGLLGAVFRGDSIPYFLSGALDFKMLDSFRKSVGNGTSEFKLTTGNVPTRPADGTGAELAKLGGLLFK